MRRTTALLPAYPPRSGSSSSRASSSRASCRSFPSRRVEPKAPAAAQQEQEQQQAEQAQQAQQRRCGWSRGAAARGTRVCAIPPPRCLHLTAGKPRNPAASRAASPRVAAVVAVAMAAAAEDDRGHTLPSETAKKELWWRRGVTRAGPRPTRGTRWETSCGRLRPQSSTEAGNTTTRRRALLKRTTRTRAGDGRGRRRAGRGDCTRLTGDARAGSIAPVAAFWSPRRELGRSTR